jgi:hypothetical protein
MGEASFEACSQSECLTERDNRLQGGNAGLHGPPEQPQHLPQPGLCQARKHGSALRQTRPGRGAPAAPASTTSRETGLCSGISLMVFMRRFLVTAFAQTPLFTGRLLIQTTIGLSMVTHCISRDFTLLNGALIWLFSCFI